MSVTLHEGLRFPNNYSKLVSAEELSGHSLQWALGALVYHTRCLPTRWARRRACNCCTCCVEPIPSPPSSSSSPCRRVEQSSSAAGWHPAPSRGGLSENMFHILMVLLFATIILAGYAYSRMLRTRPLCPPTALTRTLSFASLSRSKSFTNSRLPV